MGYLKDQIDDYQNRLTDEQKKATIKHCNKYDIFPNICAWYDDLEDFFSDWCDDLGYKRMEARALLGGKRDNKGEFKTFKDGSIIRLSM